MLAKDIMTKTPEYLLDDATVRQAAQKMRLQNYGFIPVGKNDRIIGTITDRDIAIRAVADGKDPDTTKVSDVMSKGVEYCYETDSCEQVAEKMEKLQIRRIIVLNKDKRLTGIISLGDIATKCHSEKLSFELTEAVSET